MRLPQFPTIVRFSEKHADLNFTASSEEEYTEIFDRVFLIRWNEGYWYSAPDPSEFDLNTVQKEALLYTDEMLSALPAATREELEEKREKAIRLEKARNREYREETLLWELMGGYASLDQELRLLARVDPEGLLIDFTEEGRAKGFVPVALFVLRHRIDYEYEGWENIQPDN